MSSGRGSRPGRILCDSPSWKRTRLESTPRRRHSARIRSTSSADGVIASCAEPAPANTIVDAPAPVSSVANSGRAFSSSQRKASHSRPQNAVPFECSSGTLSRSPADESSLDAARIAGVFAREAHPTSGKAQCTALGDQRDLGCSAGLRISPGRRASGASRAYAGCRCSGRGRRSGRRGRTRDPQLGKLMLYQLSYVRAVRYLSPGLAGPGRRGAAVPSRADARAAPSRRRAPA